MRDLQHYVKKITKMDTAEIEYFLETINAGQVYLSHDVPLSQQDFRMLFG